MVTINLLPIKSELRRKALIEHIMLLVLCIVLIFIGMGFMQNSVKRERETLQQEIVTTKLEIQKVTKEAGEIEQFKKRKQELERKLEIISELNTKKTGPVEVLDQISLIIPEKTWINSLNNNGQNLVLEGLAVDNPTIATFMKRLQSSEYFNDVELILAQQDGSNHKFVIKCKIKLPA
ncbi:MAG: PilN domain-containing protein [Deltaproteobacteria bacterium]|nr:PilN domain-containing protein [Deltaproteobacteria bacterium]